MTENTQTQASGGANIRTNQYSGRGADHSRRGGRDGCGRWNNNGRGGGRNNGGGRGRGNQNDLARKSSHVGQIQSGCLKGLTISSDGNRATQFKVLKDCLPVYCSEKLYEGIGEIVRNMQDWDEISFYPEPPDDTVRLTFSTPYRVKLCVEDVTSSVTDANTGVVTVVHTPTPRYGDKWVVFDENLQKIELGKYEREVREKEKQ